MSLFLLSTSSATAPAQSCFWHRGHPQPGQHPWEGIVADLPQGCRRGVDEIRLFLSSWEDSGFSRARSCPSQPRLLAEQRGGAWCGEHGMRGMYSSLQGQGLRAFPSEVMPSQLGSAPRRCFGVSVAPILPGVVLGGLGGLCCLEEPGGDKTTRQGQLQAKPCGAHRFGVWVTNISLPWVKGCCHTLSTSSTNLRHFKEIQ